MTTILDLEEKALTKSMMEVLASHDHFKLWGNRMGFTSRDHHYEQTTFDPVSNAFVRYENSKVNNEPNTEPVEVLEKALDYFWAFVGHKRSPFTIPA